MTDEQKTLINQFSVRLQKVLAHCSELEQKNARLQLANAVLTEEIEDLRYEKGELIQKNKSLIMAGSINPNTNDVKEIKEQVGQMMREIDECIEMLNT